MELPEERLGDPEKKAMVGSDVRIRRSPLHGSSWMPERYVGTVGRVSGFGMTHRSEGKYKERIIYIKLNGGNSISSGFWESEAEVIL
jgi:hypothetical protein